MGQYKVPQDVEAEDKIIGSLTLKQFLYAVIGVVYGLITFQIFKAVPVLFVTIGVPPTLLFLLLGLYKRQDQPFEALFLALVAFLVRPRKLIWEKEPIEQVFQIKEPPPKPKEFRRDPTEVRGELEKLAQIVDTRGWAAKQPELQEPATTTATLDPSDRLATFELPQVTAQEIATGQAVTLKDDMLDFENNPTAQNLDVLIQDSVKHIREEAVEKMKEQASKPASAPPPAPKPQPKAQPAAPSTSEMTTNPIAGILKVAMENSELTVSQIAAQANKQATLAPGESVSLRPSLQPGQTPVVATEVVKAAEPEKPAHKKRHTKHASRRTRS